MKLFILSISILLSSMKLHAIKNHNKILQLILTLFVCSCSRLPAQNADLVFINGNIFTADTTQLYVEALAIRGNTILAAGSNKSVEKFITTATKKIDLKGKTVVPGFNDAHDHASEAEFVGKFFRPPFTLEGPSRAAVLDTISRLLKLSKPGEWIHGLIGITVFFDTTMRVALDSLAPDNPVALQIAWGHGMVVNSKALMSAGVRDEDADPLGGWYQRTPLTHQISSMQQNAQVPIWIAINKSEPLNFVKGLRIFSNQQLAAGITTVQYMGTGFTSAFAQSSIKDADLQQRIRVIAWPRTTSDGRQFSDWNRTEYNLNPLSSISGVKYVIDGAPGEGNALRRVAYTGRGNGFGRLNYPRDTMLRIFREALTGDQQLMMHITADSSFQIVLSLMKEAGTPAEWKPKRVRIEHNCVGDISAAQQEDLKSMGIIMMHTPKYCQGSPLRSLLDNGVTVGISPDGTINPFVDILVATTMQSNPVENLTREQAVIAYTYTNAFAEFAETKKGRLIKGMLADLVVLSQNIFTIPAASLADTKSMLTMVDGKMVYGAW